MKIRAEVEMEIDMSELSIAEVQRLIQQLVQSNDSRMVKNVKVTDFKIVK